jgi:hypothetical protein
MGQQEDELKEEKKDEVKINHGIKKTGRPEGTIEEGKGRSRRRTIGKQPGSGRRIY